MPTLRPDQSSDRPPQITDANSQAQREETDDSLRAERRVADSREHGGAVEDDADRIVALARARADAIVTQARDKADHDVPESGSPAGIAKSRADADEVLQDERAAADEVLQDERAAADESLRREREDSARVLSALLPLARRSTDWKLLTERASADDALAYRDDFLGMVSHDVTNLLGGVVLSASMLARGASETPEGKRIAAGTTRILLYAARMKRLIGDLTDVTSLSMGKLAVTTAPHDGRALVAEALATFRPLAAEKRISLEVAVPDAPLPLLCDHGRILQVLANLLGNAVKFTPDGGTVSACVARIGDEAYFSVKDTGAGIPENLLEAVFERFWQAGKDDRRGLGLGLYIARNIIDAHGGRIWAESRLGEGSTFHFTFPASAPNQADALATPGN